MTGSRLLYLKAEHLSGPGQGGLAPSTLPALMADEAGAKCRFHSSWATSQARSSPRTQLLRPGDRLQLCVLFSA